MYRNGFNMTGAIFLVDVAQCCLALQLYYFLIRSLQLLARQV